MHKFEDAKGTKWTIQLDTTMTRAIRAELGVDLLNLDESSVADLVGNDETLVDVISLICTNQIEREGMDGKDFAGCLIGDALDDACDALINEVVFISSHSRRTIVAKVWQKAKAAESMMTERAVKMLDSGVVEEKVEKAMQEMEARLGAL